MTERDITALLRAHPKGLSRAALAWELHTSVQSVAPALAAAVRHRSVFESGTYEHGHRYTRYVLAPRKYDSIKIKPSRAQSNTRGSEE